MTTEADIRAAYAAKQKARNEYTEASIAVDLLTTTLQNKEDELRTNGKIEGKNDSERATSFRSHSAELHAKLAEAKIAEKRAKKDFDNATDTVQMHRDIMRRNGTNLDMLTALFDVSIEVDGCECEKVVN